VHGNLDRLTHDLVVLVDVGRAEVDENVDDEHDIDDHINDRQRVIVPARHNQDLVQNIFKPIKKMFLVIHIYYFVLLYYFFDNGFILIATPTTQGLCVGYFWETCFTVNIFFS